MHYLQEKGLDYLTSRFHLPRFSVAFQPIYDVKRGRIHAYEALARGKQGEAYPQLTAGLKARGKRVMDRVAITKVLRFAAAHRPEWQGSKITVNMLPDLKRAKNDALFVAKRARRYGIAPSEIILELIETVKMAPGSLKVILDIHEGLGFETAIDDFGSCYAGLSMLADCVPSILKLDRGLVKGIDTNTHRQKIVGGFVAMCAALGTDLVAEGVETAEEYATLERLGVPFMQGYLLAKPAYETFPAVRVPAARKVVAEEPAIEMPFAFADGFEPATSSWTM